MSIYPGLSGHKVQKHYLQIRQGKLFLKSEDTNHDLFEERVTEFNGKEFVHRGLWFDELSDKITKVDLYESQYGIMINIDTENGYTVTTAYDNRFGVHLMSKLPSVDVSKEVKIKPYDFTDEGKRIQGVNIYQDDTKVASKYTKENNKDFGFPDAPKPNKKGVIGSDDWKIFFTLRNKRLKDLLEEWIDEQEFSADISVNEKIEKATDIIVEEVDDLPF